MIATVLEAALSRLINQLMSQSTSPSLPVRPKRKKIIEKATVLEAAQSTSPRPKRKKISSIEK